MRQNSEIDNETITLLEYVFRPTETASRHPIMNHWTVDWDVATIIEALEELYPLQAEHKHLELGSRWQQVIDNSVRRVRIQLDNMEQVRRDTIHEWSGGASTIGPIPCNLNKRALRSLSQSFTHRENPHENSNPNIAFQRDLDELIEADGEFSDSPSLSRLCSLVAELVHRWEKLEMQSRRMSSSTSSRITTDKGKHFSSDRGKDYAPRTDDLHCMVGALARESGRIQMEGLHGRSGEFATKVRREPAAVGPMKIVIDEDKWRLPCNRAPPRKHSEE